MYPSWVEVIPLNNSYSSSSWAAVELSLLQVVEWLCKYIILAEAFLLHLQKSISGLNCKFLVQELLGKMGHVMYGSPQRLIAFEWVLWLVLLWPFQWIGALLKSNCQLLHAVAWVHINIFFSPLLLALCSSLTNCGILFQLCSCDQSALQSFKLTLKFWPTSPRQSLSQWFLCIFSVLEGTFLTWWGSLQCCGVK